MLNNERATAVRQRQTLRSTWSCPAIRLASNTSWEFRYFPLDLWAACAWMVAFVRRYRELRIFSWIMAVRMLRSSLMLRSLLSLLLLSWNLNAAHAARGFRHNTRHGESFRLYSAHFFPLFFLPSSFFLFFLFSLYWNLMIWLEFRLRIYMY